MNKLLVALLVCAPAVAHAIVDPISGFDTTSGIDTAMRNRGLTLSSHTAEITMRAQYIAIDEAPNQFYLRPGFGFGVTDSLELGAELLVQLEPDSAVYFAPRLVYSIVETKAVDVALTGFLLFDFDGDNDNLLPIRQFGVPVRIKLLDSLSIFTGNNAVDWRHFGDDDVINLNLNVGIGWQVDYDLALRFDTQLAAINLVGDAGSTSIGDVFPLGFGLVYAIGSRVDLTAGATYYAVDGGADSIWLDGGLLARF